MPEVRRLKRKKPSDYKLVQFRSDDATKETLDRGIENLLLLAKKDPRFKKFRKNDIYITCLQLGMLNLKKLLKDGKQSSDDLDRLANYILMRKEIQWASSKKNLMDDPIGIETWGRR